MAEHLSKSPFLSFRKVSSLACFKGSKTHATASTLRANTTPDFSVAHVLTGDKNTSTVGSCVENGISERASQWTPPLPGPLPPLLSTGEGRAGLDILCSGKWMGTDGGSHLHHQWVSVSAFASLEDQGLSPAVHLSPPAPLPTPPHPIPMLGSGAQYNGLRKKGLLGSGSPGWSSRLEGAALFLPPCGSLR